MVTADAAEHDGARRLGLRSGQVVQEFGWDEDVDDELRTAVEGITGSELLDEDEDDVVDAVLLWWREDDGDLTDRLVDALTPLAESGVVWLLTPKAGRPGHVPASDVEEATQTAGLHATSTLSPARDWIATRLLTGRARR